MRYAYIPNQENDTICALATANGAGAIAMIRLSGTKSFEIADKVFKPVKKEVKVADSKSHRLFFGHIVSGEEIIDEVVLSIFKGPHSYTGEDTVEISCHGSVYIQRRVLECLMDNGARLAQAGEYTMRAFMNGKMDLSQAEAVADLIASHSEQSHKLAIQQMRGGYSHKIGELRTQLLNFASLIELELDFSEEDVEFADRKHFHELLEQLKSELHQLIQSFTYGNVLKHGIPVAIVGKPNVGKSTLLNAILNEEKAIVSDIPGTTRDVIEDVFTVNGVTFRFIDTAGLRQSEDTIENIGIDRTYQQIEKANVVIYMFDVNECNCDEMEQDIEEFRQHIVEKLSEEAWEKKSFLFVANKTDELVESPKNMKALFEKNVIFISAKRKENVNMLIEQLCENVDLGKVNGNTIISNARHLEALKNAESDILNVEQALHDGIPTDLIAIDIRQALHHLGEITGEITTDEILGNIFGKFCIGK